LEQIQWRSNWDPWTKGDKMYPKTFKREDLMKKLNPYLTIFEEINQDRDDVEYSSSLNK
jgi:hypothetical protein